MAPSATHARLVAHQACVPEESCALSLGSISDSLIEFNKPEILFWPFLLDFYFLVNNIPTTSWPYFRQGLCFTPYHSIILIHLLFALFSLLFPEEPKDWALTIFSAIWPSALCESSGLLEIGPRCSICLLGF